MPLIQHFNELWDCNRILLIVVPHCTICLTGYCTISRETPPEWINENRKLLRKQGNKPRFWGLIYFSGLQFVGRRSYCSRCAPPLYYTKSNKFTILFSVDKTEALHKQSSLQISSSSSEASGTQWQSNSVLLLLLSLMRLLLPNWSLMIWYDYILSI